MKRTRQEDRWKELRRIDKRSSMLYREARILDWVPVEEPQFLGWEITLGLSENAQYRGDIDNLNTIMHYFDMNRTVFTRSEWVSKVVKNSGGKYLSVVKQVMARYYSKLIGPRVKYYYQDPYWYVNRYYIPYFDNTHTSSDAYQNVPDHLKSYFDRHLYPATAWRPAVPYYTLSSKFPRHELVLRVKKAWSTHRGIPKSDIISERDKLGDILRHAGYYSGWRGDTWYHHFQRKATRRHWKSMLQEAGKIKFNAWVWEEDDAPELLEKEERHLLGRSNLVKE
jgi:hypothetical protein